MPVYRFLLARPLLPRHQLGRKAVLDRSRNERNRLDLLVQFSNRPDYLELQLGDAVSERSNVETFQHDIGDAAIGRRIADALLGFDQWVGRLVLAAAIDPDFDVLSIDLAPIGPDAANASDLAFAKQEGDIGEIGILRHLRAELAVAAGRAALLEPRCPDQRAAKARRPVEARDRDALLGGKGPRTGQARPFQMPGTVDQCAVDGIAGDSACRRPYRAANGTEKAAEISTGSLQQNCRHN